MTPSDLKSRMDAFALRSRPLVELCRNEEQTKVTLINPYIDLLGYDVRDPRQVQLEYRADFHAGTERVDYAVLRDGVPWLLVEAKSATEGLAEAIPTKQIQRYVMATEAQYVVLTNGRVWAWFRKLPGEQVLEDAPFVSHDVLEPSDAEVRWLCAVHASRLDPSRLSDIADEERLQRDFSTWLDDSRTEPAESFLRLLLKICGYRQTAALLERARSAWISVLVARDAAQMDAASRRLRGEPAPPAAPVLSPVSDSSAGGGAFLDGESSSNGSRRSRRRPRFRYRLGPDDPWTEPGLGRLVQIALANALFGVLGTAEMQRAADVLNDGTRNDGLRAETIVFVELGVSPPRYFHALDSVPYAIYVNLGSRDQVAWYARARRVLPSLDVQTDSGRGLESDADGWVSVLPADDSP